MIEELRISSLGVIVDAALEFSPGLTVVTGETGAGKTMVVTGLGLLLGERADPSTVRQGADRADVEGRFAVSDEAIREVVESAGGELDDGQIILRRSIASQGRSRAYAGGAGVPATVLSSLAPSLVVVHGQAEQQELLSTSRQRRLLDAFADNRGLLADYHRAYTELQEVEERLALLIAQRQERLREADLLRFGVAEVEGVSPTIGEDAALRQEEERLAFAEELRNGAGQARVVLDDDSDSSVIAMLAQVRQSLDSVRDHDERVAALADRAAELGYLAAELSSDLSGYIESVASEPQRLADIGDRRAALGSLLRKYGTTLDEVLTWSSEASARLVELDATDDDVAELTAAVTKGRAELGQLATDLSRRRQSAAHDLGDRVSVELRDLAMPDATVRAAVTQREATTGLQLSDGRCVEYRADGIDDVTLILQPHADVSEQPIGKGASGGELSRIMLAIEVVLAGSDGAPTMVFDEVDAGVGGRAAVEVGKRLAQLSRHAQVIVVTHLPQVAAFADRHLVVTKSSDGAVTRSDVGPVDDAARAQELARMLAGLEDSDLGRAHASELLDLAARAKKQGSTPSAN